VASSQTLSEPDRRLLARWAACCAERALPLFEPTDPTDHRILEALARARAFSEGRSTAAAEIRLRMVAVSAAGAATNPGGAAAGRAVAQAAAVAHMGAHAFGAAAYAVRAVTLARPDQPDLGKDELYWQLGELTAPERAALRQLPALGSDSAGPLGPGLLTRGRLGDIVRQLQTAITDD